MIEQRAHYAVDKINLRKWLSEEEIAKCNTVFVVSINVPTFRGDREFVLGPESVCGSVMGLVDPEYGWPERVDYAPYLIL